MQFLFTRELTLEVQNTEWRDSVFIGITKLGHRYMEIRCDVGSPQENETYLPPLGAARSEVQAPYFRYFSRLTL